jgi:hypothetical protein
MMRMRQALVGIVVLLGGAIVPSSLAWAKGPVGVEVDGADLEAPIVVDMNSAAPDAMWALLEQVGLFAGTQTVAAPPEGDLGPVYRLTWFMSESRNRDRVLQDVYPLAEGGPFVHTLPGRTSWPQLVSAGWAIAGADLPDALTGIGLPLATPDPVEAEVPAPATVQRPPVESATGRPWLVIFAAFAALLAVVVLAATVGRSRGNHVANRDPSSGARTLDGTLRV